MKKITFDEEELYAIAVFNMETREKAITGMEKVLDLMDDDPEMKALLVSVKEKLKRISDKDFKELDVERYIEELEEEEAIRITTIVEALDYMNTLFEE